MKPKLCAFGHRNEKDPSYRVFLDVKNPIPKFAGVWQLIRVAGHPLDIPVAVGGARSFKVNVSVGKATVVISLAVVEKEEEASSCCRLSSARLPLPRDKAT